MLFRFLKRNTSPKPALSSKSKRIPLQEQIKNFSELGLELNPSITFDSLLEIFTEEEYEHEPYQLLALAMGGEIERNGDYTDISEPGHHTPL